MAFARKEMQDIKNNNPSHMLRIFYRILHSLAKCIAKLTH